MSDIEVSIPRPHEAQKQVLGEKKRFNVLNCGRRWGKSNLATSLLAVPAINGNPVGYFAPTYKLLEGTFNECIGILGGHVAGTKKVSFDDLIVRKHDQQFIETLQGGKIEFWSLENELAGRSRKYYRTIIDEAAFVKSLWQSWTESIRPTLTDLRGDAWFLSTPRGKNDFYKLFMRGKSEDRWASWQMPTLTNPYIDPEEIADAKSDLPENAFRQEYMAEFLENVANPFGYPFIQQCTFPMSTDTPICYGIDLAKSYDYTVIIGLDRFGIVCYFDRFQMDWASTSKKILELKPCPMAIDSTGVGSPIAEGVSLVRDVDSFVFTPQSKQELMGALALAIQKRVIGFPEGHIKDELESFEYEFTKSGVRFSAPSGLHDDCVCALALAWYKWQTAGVMSDGPSVW